MTQRAYLYAIEIDRVEDGEELESAPFHCTIMPWFVASATLDDLRRVTAPVFYKHPLVHLIAYKRGWFGPNNDVPVTIIRRNGTLRSLHFGLFNALSQVGAISEQERYIGTRYRPHVSDCGGHEFGIAARFVSRWVYLIEADPHHHTHKRVVEHFQLGA